MRNCHERITVGSPDPTWDTIERFIRQALNAHRQKDAAAA
jgi:hypothetical protein